MLREFKIGEGDNGCSSVVIFGIKDDEDNNISQNSVSFWIHHTIFDCEIIIMKNTKEGQILQKKIKDGESIHIINRYIDKLVVNLLSITDIKQGIKEVYEEGIKDGIQQAKREIQIALGL